MAQAKVRLKTGSAPRFLPERYHARVQFLLQKGSSGREPPPGCAAQEFLLVQPEHQPRTNHKHRLLHREDVLLHARHVKVVLRFVLLEELPSQGHFRNPYRPFHDHPFVRIFRANHAPLVSPQVASLARLAPRAENESSIQPQSPHHHGVGGPVRLHRADPIVMTLLQPLFGPLPGQQSFAALRQPVSGHLWTGGLGLLPAWFSHTFFFVHCSIVSSALFRFSSELATLNRKSPSPKSP